jgi:LSM domain
LSFVFCGHKPNVSIGFGFLQKCNEQNQLITITKKTKTLSWIETIIVLKQTLLSKEAIRMAQQEVVTEHATDLKSGPFSVLYSAVRGNAQILVNLRNNHKLIGRVKAYDRHMNLYV